MPSFPWPFALCFFQGTNYFVCCHFWYCLGYLLAYLLEGLWYLKSTIPYKIFNLFIILSLYSVFCHSYLSKDVIHFAVCLKSILIEFLKIFTYMFSIISWLSFSFFLCLVLINQFSDTLTISFNLILICIFIFSFTRRNQFYTFTFFVSIFLSYFLWSFLNHWCQIPVIALMLSLSPSRAWSLLFFPQLIRRLLFSRILSGQVFQKTKFSFLLWNWVLFCNLSSCGHYPVIL